MAWTDPISENMPSEVVSEQGVFEQLFNQRGNLYTGLEK